MKLPKPLYRFAALSLVAALPAAADVVRTTDGARLTGSLERIEDGMLYLSTAYAGKLEIAQEKVASFTTDDPVFVRLKSGTVMAGPVKSGTGGGLRIRSEDGTLNTSMDRVTASWSPEDEDPRIRRMRAKREELERDWSYEAGADLLGKEGNSEEFALGINFEARLKSPDDELRFYGEYEQREKNGDKTEDRAAGGMSYEAFFSKIFGWYVRTELETDAIDEVDLRSTSAGGASYRLINKENQNLVARSGLGYRYTAYDAERDNESTATLDFGLDHTLHFKDAIFMENTLTYVPSLDDFGNYRVVHDSGVEIPVGSGDNWKLRMGVKNEYESEPVAEENLDTTYYSRMIYFWE